MDLQAYLQRINYQGSTDVSYGTLCGIHRAHLFTVPFENLNIHIPRPIVVEETAIYQKIVDEKRGGFCFEQNGLLAWALKTIGFDVQLLEARVYRQNTQTFGNPFEHLTLLVTLDQRYLADVGFGAGFVEPLQLDNPAIQVQPQGAYRVEHDDTWGTYFGRPNGHDAFDDGYRFSLTPHQLSDFVDACAFVVQNPESHFTQKRICSIAQPDGRITLTDRQLIRTTHAGEREETDLHNEDDFHQALAEQFGITVQTQPPQVVNKG